MATQRQSWVHGNQFTASSSTSVDFEVNTANIPVGSTLERTWVDVRFNRIGQGTEPEELLNHCGPFIWGLCFFDDAADDPGDLAEDDGIDWLWREMIAFGPPIPNPNAITGDPQWVQASQSPTGWRNSKGRRLIRQAPCFLHWCFNIPNLFSSAPIGLHWEVFVHTLWTVH